MKYVHLNDNLLLLFHICGGIKQEQVIRFFGDKNTVDNIRFYLNKLGHDNLVRYSAETDTLLWRGGYAVKLEVLRKRIYAFWAIADVGSDNIYEISLATYPSQFFFVTNDGDAYDVTYVTSRLEAQMAMRERNLSTVKNVEDDINHIAVIKTPEEAEEYHLREYGFDFFCIYDSNHVPHYTALTEGTEDTEENDGE